MSFVDAFFGMLFSPLGLPFWMGIGAALGIFIGMWLSRPRRNVVSKLVPEDSRGYDLDILEENSTFIHCQPLETLPPQRFLKFRKSYIITGPRRFGRLQKITRYLGREGTAYSQRIEGGEVSNIPLDDTLKTLWGQEGYDTVRKNAPTLMKAVEDSKINITVAMAEDPLTPDGMKVISEENIKLEEDKEAARTFWQGKKDAIKGAFVDKIAWMGFGAAIIVVALLFLGQIGAPAPIVITGGNSTRILTP